MRGRAADVDADSLELDGLLAPDVMRDFGAIGLGELAVLVKEVGIVHGASQRMAAVARRRLRATAGARAAATRRASSRVEGIRCRLRVEEASSRARFSSIRRSVLRVVA